MATDRTQSIINYLEEIVEDEKYSQSDKMVAQMFMQYAPRGTIYETEGKGKKASYKFLKNDNALRYANEFKTQGFPAQIAHVVNNLISYLMVSVYLQMKVSASSEVFYMARNEQGKTQVLKSSQLVEFSDEDKKQFTKVNKVHVNSINSAISKSLTSMFPKVVNGIARRLYGSSKVFSDPQTYSKIYLHDAEFVDLLLTNAFEGFDYEKWGTSERVQEYFETIWLAGSIKNGTITKISAKFLSVLKTVEVLIEKSGNENQFFIIFLKQFGFPWEGLEYSRANIESAMQKLKQKFCESQIYQKYEIYKLFYQIILAANSDKIGYLSLDLFKLVTVSVGKGKNKRQALFINVAEDLNDGLKIVEGPISYEPLTQEVCEDAVGKLNGLASNKVISSAIGMLSIKNPVEKDKHFHELPENLMQLILDKKRNEVIDKIVKDMRKKTNQKRTEERFSILPPIEVLNDRYFQNEIVVAFKDANNKKTSNADFDEQYDAMLKLAAAEPTGGFSHNYQIVFNSLFKLHPADQPTGAEFKRIQDENQYSASLVSLAKGLMKINSEKLEKDGKKPTLGLQNAVRSPQTGGKKTLKKHMDNIKLPGSPSSEQVDSESKTETPKTDRSKETQNTDNGSKVGSPRSNNSETSTTDKPEPKSERRKFKKATDLIKAGRRIGSQRGTPEKPEE